MNKTIKVIALCLCVVAFTALFAGCDMLDKMKSDHALISDDKESITFRGETYRKLPEDAPFYFEQISSYEDDENISVTDEGVPVLLSEGFSYSAFYNYVSDVIYVNNDSKYIESSDDFFYFTVYDYSNSDCYCREDLYNKYIDAYENSTLDRVGFEYEVTTYDTYEVSSDPDWYITLGILSKEASDEILSHIQNPDKLTDYVYSKVCNEYDYPNITTLSFSKCDSEGLLVEYVNDYNIMKNEDGEAFLVNYYTEKAVKLSQSCADEIDDKYFYGEYFQINEHGDKNIIPPPEYSF